VSIITPSGHYRLCLHPKHDFQLHNLSRRSNPDAYGLSAFIGHQFDISRLFTRACSAPATDRAAQRTLAKLVTKAASTSETPQPTQTPSRQPNRLRIGLLRGHALHHEISHSRNSFCSRYEVTKLGEAGGRASLCASPATFGDSRIIFDR